MVATVNTFKCCKSPKVVSEVSVTAVLDEIRSGKKYGSLVERARLAGKGTTEFDLIKELQLPTFTANAIFSESRRLNDLMGLTGLLYFDVDGITNIDLNKDLIYASWLSVSGEGRGVLVKVIGLNRVNFREVYFLIAEELGLEVDKSCCDVTRQIVLSHDPHIYVNENSSAYVAFDVKPNETGNKGILSKAKGVYAPLLPIRKEPSSEIVYDNYSNLEIPEGYRVYNEKIYASKLFVPRLIRTGKRHDTIRTFMRQLIGLNPQLSIMQLDKYLRYINTRCEEPYSDRQLREIAKRLIEEKERGEIEPLANLPRAILFDKDFPAEDKPKICGMVSGQVRIKNSIRRIHDILIDWEEGHGNPTIKKISELTGITPKTVSKHLKTQPELAMMYAKIKQLVRV